MKPAVLMGLLWLAWGCDRAPAGPPPPARPAVADPADWCAEHALPESMCTKCNPALVVRYKAVGDFCAGHGFPESVCPLCHPLAAPPADAAAKPPADQAPAKAEDWCAGHGLPESKCTQCNPELTAEFKAAGDWCGEHGFPESACPKCNPVAPPQGRAPAPAKAEDWCAGHGLPESKCTKCNPELTAEFKAAGDWCAEHGFPESACPKCNPARPPAAAVVPPGTVVRLGTPARVKAAGIQTVPATRRAVAATITAPARVDFDRDALAEVRAPVPGIVRAVRAGLGQLVVAGDPLFELESVRVGDLQARRRSAKARVDAARAHLKRQTALRADAIASKRALELAQRELAAARAELKGIDQSLAISGAGRGGAAGRFVVAAPLGGQIIRRPAVVGAYAGAEDRLATVADTGRMWLLLDLAEGDAARVRTGQRVVARVDGVPDRAPAGTVDWVAAEVDPRTRRVAARAALANPDGALRAGQFAQATVHVGAPAAGVAVPRAAVQRVGEAAVVFVQVGASDYAPRVVQPGASDGPLVLVEGDLQPGDAVVTTGAYLLRTELNRDAIGAGCCEVGEGGE